MSVNTMVLPPKRNVYDKEVPIVPETVVSKDAYISSIRLSNTSAGAITFTLADRQGTPLERYKDVSIAANSVSLEVLSRNDEPIKMVSGFTVDASAAGLEATIVYYTRP